MSDEEAAKNLRLFDRRVVERNIKKGLVSRKDYEKYLKSLGDTATNIAAADERLPDTDDDDDDLDDDDEVDALDGQPDEPPPSNATPGA